MLKLVVLIYSIAIASKNFFYPSSVIRIIDGDTFEVKKFFFLKERVRILGVNTPEKGEKNYKEATDSLRKLCGSSVKLKRMGFDRYKRTLAVVYSWHGCVNVRQRKKYKCTKFDSLLSKKQREILEKEGWK
jgi:micrococcal nuclease